jgi:hypothetical protein
MGIRWTESFDWTDSTTDITTRKWGSSVWGGAAITLRVGGGRHAGDNCIRFTHGPGAGAQKSMAELRLGATFAGNVPIMGAAIRVSAWPASGYILPIFHLVESGASDAGCVLALADDGRLRLMKNSLQYVDGNAYAGPQITPGEWFYVELKGAIGSNKPAGTVQLCVDGEFASQNTATYSFGYLGNNLATVKLGGYYSSTAHLVGLPEGESIEYDDVYVADTNLSQPFPLGDCTVDCLVPDGVGSSAQWSPSQAGTPNWQLVDDAVPDGDTSYVATSGSGNRDLYTMQDIGIRPEVIHAVMLWVEARRDDGITRRVSGSIRSGGTVFDNAYQPTLGASYVNYPFVWGTDPATGAAWTFDGINSLEAGVKHV